MKSIWVKCIEESLGEKVWWKIGVDGMLAMEGKMMRKTVEKMREYDRQQWEKKWERRGK